MKFARIQSVAILLAVTALSGCGGGGNELGPIEEIELSQSTLTVTGPPGLCASGISASIFVFGGTPPYKLYNSVPDAVALDKSQVNNAGDAFVVTFTAGCLDNMPISVTDEAGKVTKLLLINQKGPTS